TDAVYVPLAIRDDYASFESAINSLRVVVALRGLSVTIPHKENALRYAQEKKAHIEEIAIRTGVVNTLVFPADNSEIKAKNTDHAGALAALGSAMDITREGLRGVDTAILGAGGAARAIVAALADHGAKIAIYNRTFERAQSLAAEFTTAAVTAEKWENL